MRLENNKKELEKIYCFFTKEESINSKIEKAFKEYLKENLKSSYQL